MFAIEQEYAAKAARRRAAAQAAQDPTTDKVNDQSKKIGKPER